MRADPSAYAVLGLDPDADAAAIERAYKSLIKLHHPDKPGGDAARAADINRAYRELISPDRQRGDIALHQHRPSRLSGERWGWSGSAWTIAAAIVVGLTAGLMTSQPRIRAVTGPIAEAVNAATKENGRHPVAIDIMDRPLNLSAIDSAVLQAATVAQVQDDNALSAASRSCHERLQSEPALSQFDRCTAFDDAVVKLRDRDPLRDGGNFSQLAVTGRQWAAASSLSNDEVATDSRLKQIRLRVELLLTPAEDGEPRAEAP